MNLVKIVFAKIAFTKIGLIIVTDNLNIDLAINLKICSDFPSHEKIIQT
jgi:hypothetical protein